MSVRLVKPPEGLQSATNVEAGLNMLVYGPPKAGKTRLALTLVNSPKVTGLLYVDIDGSPSSFPSPLPERLIRATVPSGGAGWRKCCEYLAYLRNGEHDINAAVFDTLSTLGVYALEHTLEANITDNKRDKEKRLALPGPSDYGAANRALVRFVRAARDLSIERGYHIFFTSHEKRHQADSGAVSYNLDLSGQSASMVAGIPDIVGRLLNTKKGRLLSLVGSEKSVAGVRLPEGRENPLGDVLNVKEWSLDKILDSFLQESE